MSAGNGFTATTEIVRRRHGPSWGRFHSGGGDPHALVRGVWRARAVRLYMLTMSIFRAANPPGRPPQSVERRTLPGDALEEAEPSP